MNKFVVMLPALLMLSGCNFLEGPLIVRKANDGTSVSFQSQTSEVTITNLIFNEGNCPVNMTDPITLKFGESDTYMFGLFTPCDVLKVDIETDQGTFTYTFPPQ